MDLAKGRSLLRDLLLPKTNAICPRLSFPKVVKSERIVRAVIYRNHEEGPISRDRWAWIVNEMMVHSMKTHLLNLVLHPTSMTKVGIRVSINSSLLRTVIRSGCIDMIDNQSPEGRLEVAGCRAWADLFEAESKNLASL